MTQHWRASARAWTLAGCVTVVLGMTGATLAWAEAPSTLSEQIKTIAQRMVVEVYAALRDAKFC